LLIVGVVLCVVIGAGGIGLGWWLPGIVAAEVGRLTNTQVKTGSLGFRWDGSVSIHQLSIRPQQDDPGSDSTIFRAEDVQVRFSRRSLLSLSPRVTELYIEDFVLDVQRDLDRQRWNVGTLRLSRFGGKNTTALPSVVLRDGRLRYAKVSGGKTEIVMTVPVEGRFGFGLTPQGYGFEIKTSTLSGGYGQSHLRGYWRPGELAVAGGLSSADLPSLERAWAIDVLAGQLRYEPNGDYRFDLRLKDLHGKQAPEVGALQQIVSGSTGDGPLTSLQRFFARYRPTGVVESISVSGNGNFQRLDESEVLGTIICQDVSVCDVEFPYVIDHLRGEIDFTQSGLVLKDLAGKHGPVDVRIEGWSRGRGAERQYRYKISSPNMILDEALYAALQPGQKRLWDAFDPSGRVAVDYRLMRTSPTDKRMYVSVDLDGVSAAFDGFPYPLTDLTGSLYFDHESITATHLVSKSGNCEIRLNAKVTGLGTARAMHYVSIDGTGIPLDATLERSLPPQYQELYGRLEVDGTADVRARVFTTGDANHVGPISYHADVVCYSKTLRLEQSPLTLSDVVAELAVSPKSVTIQKLDGLYGQSRIALEGGMELSAGAKTKPFRVNVTAQEVPFNETTIGLLPSSLAGPLATFRPEGNVNLRLELQVSDGDASPTVTGTMECLGIKIRHRDIPYPLREVRGTISLSRDHLVVAKATASPVDPCQPQSATIYVDGAVARDENGLAGGSFVVRTKELCFTKSLGEALPQEFAQVYRDLAPQGPFDVNACRLMISRVSSGGMRVEITGRAALHACELRVAGRTVELAGDVEVESAYDTENGLSRGRAALADGRLVIKGRTISHATAEAVYDPVSKAWEIADLLGDCYRGKVLGSLRMARAETGRIEYVIQAILSRVDVQEFLREGKAVATAEAPYSGGVMNASLSLGGRAGDLASQRGICLVNIEKMRVGKVSPLRNLLSVLSLNEPTDYTFDRMLIDSYLRQDMLLIRKLDMSGRNVAFTGSGTMALSDGRLHLMLTARGQRLAAAEPSVFQALTEGLGGAVVRMEVTGDASNPVVQTKALPVLEESLRILGAPE